MDLGVSSYQLDNDERGFSYARNVELDMRMDKTSPIDAKVILQTYSYEELTKILYIFGEEKFAKKIAAAIVTEREKNTIKYSAQLAEIIKCIACSSKTHRKNPVKTFQALRIEVNRELEILKKALPNALSALNVGGVIVVESYHSLEDRMVKTILLKEVKAQHLLTYR